MDNKELVILAAKGGGGGSVTSVNGKTGAVVLDAEDVGAVGTTAQELTNEQKAQARSNIGAASATSSIPSEVKSALLNCFYNVAWENALGKNYYDALADALYPPSDLDHITAVYTQTKTIYTNDSLDALKPDLVVTAYYSGLDSRVLPFDAYTLSGTLTAGTSTITATYSGKTATFTVTVTQYVSNLLHSWDLTQSLVDSVGNITAITTATRGATGLVFDAAERYCDFGAVYAANRTYELDVAEISTKQSGGGSNRRIFMADVDANTAYGGGSGLIYGRSGTNWTLYSGTGWLNPINNQMTTRDFFNGKTLRVYVDSDMIWHIYAKTTGSADAFTLVGTSPSAMKTYMDGHVYIGGNKDDAIADARFTALRVYDGEVA